MSGRKGHRTPSPAMLVAVIALVAALSGTAIAADFSKKDIKKISGKVIDKAAPDLTVGNSQQLGGQPPNSYQDIVAYAHVLTDGSVVGAESKGVAASNVTARPLASFCFTGLPQFKSVNVSPDFQSNTADNADVSALIAMPGAGGFATGCNNVNGLQAEIATVVDSNFTPHGFYVQFLR